MKTLNTGETVGRLSSSKSNLGARTGRSVSAESNVVDVVPFSVFKRAVAAQFETMRGLQLYETMPDAESRNLMWDLYLKSFPEGTNEVYRERTEHDCQCCKQFIRNVGGVVAIKDGRVVTLWDSLLPHDALGQYAVVAAELRAYVLAHGIHNVFLHPEPTVGTDKTFQQVASMYADDEGKLGRETKSTQTWEHFFLRLPPAAVKKADAIGTLQSVARSTYDVLKRGLEELTLSAVDTALELIAQGTLYKGDEQKFALTEFRKMKVLYETATSSDEERDVFCWSFAALGSTQAGAGSALRIRNTAVGTLLQDLSADMDLDEAVGRWEKVTAPTNYKRPTALVTKAMVEKARAAIDKLGLATALERRHAHIDDIKATDVLWSDRTTAPRLKRRADAFDDIVKEIPVAPRKLLWTEEVSIDKFLADVLPNARSLEVMVENGHVGNFVALVAPTDPAAGRLFKWGNQFSWSYAGEVTDSIKARVKAAGGNVEADLRCSLSWWNYDDLDLHMKEPGFAEISYRMKRSPFSGGHLDVDMNAGGGTPGSGTRSAVENIAFPDRQRMPAGKYVLYVENYRRMESVDVGFEVEVEFDGQAHLLSYPKAVRDGEQVPVAEFNVAVDVRSGRREFAFKALVDGQARSKDVWGLRTASWAPVDAVMLSPNYWGTPHDAEHPEARPGEGVGHKHFFFMLRGCRSEGRVRGFYNEFLAQELNEHRKTLETVGARMPVEEDVRQLSGLGFSSTKRAVLLVKVKGEAERTLKVAF